MNRGISYCLKALLLCCFRPQGTAALASHVNVPTGGQCPIICGCCEVGDGESVLWMSFPKRSAIVCKRMVRETAWDVGSTLVWLCAAFSFYSWVGSLRLLGPVHGHHVNKNERVAWLRGALGALSHMHVFVSRVPVDLRQSEQEFVHGRGQRRMRM